MKCVATFLFGILGLISIPTLLQAQEVPGYKVTIKRLKKPPPRVISSTAPAKTKKPNQKLSTKSFPNKVTEAPAPVAVAPSAPSGPGGPLDHLKKINEEIVVFDQSVSPARKLASVNAVAINSHFFITALSPVLESMSEAKIKIFHKTLGGAYEELRVRDLDVQSGLALLHCPSELKIYLSPGEIMTSMIAQASDGSPWQVLNAKDIEVGSTRFAVPSVSWSDEFSKHNTLNFSPRLGPELPGTLLVNKNMMVAGLYLGPSANKAQEHYAKGDEIQYLILKASSYPNTIPDSITRAVALETQFENVQKRILNFVSVYTLPRAVQMNHWALRTLFPKLFDCRSPNETKTICDSQWPFWFSATEPMLQAHLDLQELEPTALSPLGSPMLDEYDAQLKGVVKDPDRLCRQSRVSLADRFDTQTQICVVDHPPFRKRSLFRGVILKKDSPLYFELALTGFSAEQASLFSRNLLENLEWSPHGNP